MSARSVVLHITAPSRVGGLERVVSALATRQVGVGRVVHVAAVAGSSEEAEPFLAPLRVAGVVTHTVVVSSRDYIGERAQLRALCRAIAPSIVHTHGYRSDVIASGVARALGVPTVTTAHGFTGGGFRNQIYEFAQRRMFRAFDAVVAVSQPLYDRLLAAGVPRHRLHFIQNAWSGTGPLDARDIARTHLGLAPATRVLGWVGRLTSEKGADVLIDAIPKLKSGAIACVVGDGAQRPALAARASALGVGSRVVWCGVRDDAAALMPAFDAFVLSSRTEGTPIVLFEAMAARVPIVATRVGGVPAVVSDVALLVPADDPGALAAAIDNVFERPEDTLRRVDVGARRLVEQFSVAPWVSAYEALYDHVLAQRAKMI